jgi:hypothetical protein
MQPVSSFSPVAIYCLVFLAASAAWLGSVIVLRRTTLRRSTVILLIAAGIAIRLALLPFHPIGSDDVFRYMWDGRVQSHGIDPYAFAPGDSALAALHTADLPARVNNPSFKTPYLPFTQWIFLLAYQFGGEEPAGIKLLLFLSECLTLFLLARLLKHLDLPPQNILFYALCPLPIFQFALDGHIDGVGIPLILGAVFLWLQDRRAFALFLLGLSISVKPVGLVLLPMLLFNEKSWKWKFLICFIPIITIFCQFFPYFWSSNPFEGILVFGRNWSYNGALFQAVYAVLLENQVSRVVCGVLLLAILPWVVLRRWGFPGSAYYSVLFLLLCSPVVHPWYVTWLGTMLPLAFAWSGALFIALVSLTSFTLVEYQSTGIWALSPWILVLEYVPVFVAVFFEIKKNRRTSYDAS